MGREVGSPRKWASSRGLEIRSGFKGCGGQRLKGVCMNEIKGLTVLWLGVVGAVMGSFLECAVSRWAAGNKDPLGGRSRCDSCRHQLGVRDLVPVFSYVCHRGKCRWCGEKIPTECLWAEVAGVVALAGIGFRFGPTLELGQWVLWVLGMLALALIDLKRRLIPDRILVALVWNRLVWFVVLGQELNIVEVAAALGIAGWVLIGVLFTEKMWKTEAMGGGDIKLLFTLALYLNWGQMILMVLLACVGGLVWAAKSKVKKGQLMAFGPWIVFGAWLTVCFGGPVLDWYFGLMI